MRRDHVVTTIGAIVIVAVLMGLIVVEGRAGPFDHELVPAQVPVTMRGGFAATAPTGTPAPGGVCVPPPGDTECAPARTRLLLEVEGLPHLAADARYMVFLQGDGALSAVGPLDRDEEGHVLRYDEAVDGRGFQQLIVSLQATTDVQEPGPLVVYRHALVGGGGAVDLDGAPSFAMEGVHGDVHVAQIGAVSISTVADARVHGLPADGWRYDAWLVDEADGSLRHNHLGALEPGADGGHVLDARVERLELGAQERFLVTARPTGAPVEPAGFPVFDRTLGR